MRCDFLDYGLHHDRSQHFYFWQEMMQDFTLQVQDGVQCLVVAVLLLHGFILHFASIIADRLLSNARTSRNKHVIQRRAKRRVDEESTVFEVADHIRLVFCSDLQLRSAKRSRTHAQVRRNRADDLLVTVRLCVSQRGPHSIFSFSLFVRMVSRLEFVEEGRSSEV